MRTFQGHLRRLPIRQQFLHHHFHHRRLPLGQPRYLQHFHYPTFLLWATVVHCKIMMGFHQKMKRY